ncbi:MULTISPECIES: helix-turn-helix domain-containing protein [unclassified Enterococcus]|jgi:hypothetical protein|uniref:helix-turn-helix domain-containing protein n=1 Tax=unclassified Enterococcus TaxID=2608891 RepID=UPI003D29DF31
MKRFQLEFITDKKTTRWLKILNEFERQPILSGSVLAASVDSTKRTIVNDIQDIREHFGESINLTISNIGYHFIELDPVKYHEAKTALVKEEPVFIILEAIFHNELYTLNEWADKLYLAAISLRRFLNRLDSILGRYDLTLGSSPVDLIGKEVNIRKFFHDFYYESEITPHTVHPSVQVQEMIRGLSNDAKLKKFEFTSFGDFSYILHISIERYTRNKGIRMEKAILEKFEKDEGFLAFCQFDRLVEKYAALSLNKDELLYIYLNIITDRNIKSREKEAAFCESYTFWPEIEQLADDYFSEVLFDTEGAKEKEKVFLTSFLTTVKLKELLSINANQNIEDINYFAQNNFPKDFEKTLAFLQKQPFFKEYKEQDLFTDLSASLTIFIQTIKELYWRKSKNICFILEGNHQICQYIQSFAIRRLSKFHQLFFPTSDEFVPDYVKKNKLDLVVTNHQNERTEWQTDIDTLLIKSVPNHADWESLLEKIDAGSWRSFGVGPE